MSTWQCVGEGHYALKMDCGEYVVIGVAVLEGEIWKTVVAVDGVTVDKGEWDGRGVALSNARGAMRRARFLRDVERFGRDRQEEEEDDEL